MGRKHSAWLFCTRGCLRDENVFFEKVLADKFFQVPPECLAMDDLVSLTVVIRTVFFYSGKYKVILEWPRAPYPRLFFMALKILLMGSFSGVKCCSILKVWGEFGKMTGNICLL